MNKNKKKQLILTVIGLVGLIAITVGVSVAFFNYTKAGTSDNTLTTGSVSFMYTEVSGIGRGIMLEDAIPMSDDLGKAQTGAGKVFDFKITSKTGNASAIPYVVTARMSSDSNLDTSKVRIYLEKDNEQVLLDNYSELDQTDKVAANTYTEKVLYEGKVPRNSENYVTNFKLKMWLSDQAISQNNEYPYNDKIFKITVNVYADGSVLTQQDIDLESSANITSLSLGSNSPLTPIENGTYDYETTTSDRNITINVTPENPNAQVQIEKVNSFAYNEESNIKRLSNSNVTSQNITLTGGDNYIKITVTPEDTRISPTIYKLHIYKTPSTDATLSSLSISGCTLNETFDSTTTSYTCSTSRSNITVTAVSDNGADIQVTGESNLQIGQNTITIISTPEDTSAQAMTYSVTVTREKQYVEVTGDSVLKILEDNDLEEGYYNFKINGKTETYPVHLYVYDGNTTISTDTKFGAEDDVSTEVNGVRQYAEAMVAVKVKGNLTNNAKIEPYYNETTGYGGPKGLLLYVTGTLTNNGTIDNSHGAYAEGQDVYLWKNANGTYEKVPAVGGLAGQGTEEENILLGKSGVNGINRQTGGGGAGRGYSPAHNYYAITNGSNGTSYSGGTGGSTNDGYDGMPNGGPGGGSGAGGAGNPAGTPYSAARAGENGTGGLLVIYANSFINTSNVTALGHKGGAGNHQGAGSSGGGSVNIFYKNQITVGNINVQGGERAVCPEKDKKGGAGGNGTVSIGSISTGTYVAN